MDRRLFLQMAAASAGAARGQSVPRAAQRRPEPLPEYSVVSKHERQESGFPGAFPGRVVCVKSGKSIEPSTGAVDIPTVTEMVKAGMQSLTGRSNAHDAWASMFQASDVVGVKVNCSGAPAINSHPELVGEIVRNLIAVGVAPANIYIYERFPDQVATVHFDRHVPKDVNIVAVEKSRDSLEGYDPRMYVEVNFFGEQNTRSNVIALVSQKFTKIINVPVMKDHGAAGVTGCLKNIAYGNFSNVARSHKDEKTNTYTFIGTLAATEPLRSRTVLNIMDGLKGVWHGGPFLINPAFAYYPRQILFGTDPVAMDRLLLDAIEEKRKAEGAVSVWDRGREHLKPALEGPNFNPFIREPGHIEMAGKMGLGVYDKAKINRIDLNV
jgi:uncharacterized protein (DUF362 family)